MTKKHFFLIAAILVLALVLAGCFPSQPEVTDVEPEQTGVSDANTVSAKPKLPEKLELVDGVPTITVYNVAAESNQDIDIEKYVEGVLAGEMKNDWPIEALKAQAILARTFVLKFINEKKSTYEGADISTDIKEAQAYDADAVNDRIRYAVDDTRGLIMTSSGEFPYAWFHAHAGGMTELAKAALQYKDSEPPYTKVVESPDSDDAPDNVKAWTAEFTVDEVSEAAGNLGVKTGAVETIEIGYKGQSERAITLSINGKSVSAPALRLELGSTKLKSTLFSDITVEDGKVIFSGKGYGHGVGMSQWGAYELADEGQNAEQIVKHYFNNVDIVKMWD